MSKELVEVREKELDLYKVLELPDVCSLSDIKKQYRKLALVYHPDKSTLPKTEAIENFHKISLALKVLNNERDTYDRWINTHRQKIAFKKQKADELREKGMERQAMVFQLERQEQKKTQKYVDLSNYESDGMRLKKMKFFGIPYGDYKMGPNQQTQTRNVTNTVVVTYKNNVYVTLQDFEHIFSQFGNVVECSFSSRNSSQDKYAVLYVEFESTKDALRCLEYDFLHTTDKLLQIVQDIEPYVRIEDLKFDNSIELVGGEEEIWTLAAKVLS